MELGGFEPPTSWVRSRLAVSESKLSKVTICRDYKRVLVSAFRSNSAGYARIYTRICGDSGTNRQ
jgi:hypothetical protein